MLARLGLAGPSAACRRGNTTPPASPAVNDTIGDNDSASAGEPGGAARAEHPPSDRRHGGGRQQGRCQEPDGAASGGGRLQRRPPRSGGCGGAPRLRRAWTAWRDWQEGAGGGHGPAADVGRMSTTRTRTYTVVPRGSALARRGPRVVHHVRGVLRNQRTRGCRP